jgi:protein-ribulosamine 3-kinase
MKLDPAVAEILSLDPSQASISSAGGGGCSSASTDKITAKTKDGAERHFFMKSGSGSDAEVMFKGKTWVLFIFAFALQ